ncbi:M23 family metallopeptidase [Nocardioidaceae bacterium]|nr:M23 family metallopeptidase [Nocardioidaceae bacterium]
MDDARATPRRRRRGLVRGQAGTLARAMPALVLAGGVLTLPLGAAAGAPVSTAGPALPDIPTAVGGLTDTTDTSDTADAPGSSTTLGAAAESTVAIDERRAQARAERRRRAADVRRAAERLEADRQVALTAMWEPDPTLLAPRESDSPQTAEVRSRLAALVERLSRASSDYEEALYAADRSRVEARRARAASAAAAERSGIARQRWVEDRAALVAIATDTYRNGSVGDLGLVLGAGSAEDDEAFFSGLTLLTQVNSSQGDATARAAASARALADAVAEQERAEARAERTAVRNAAALSRSARTRTQVVEDVRRAQALIQQSILVDEIAAAVDTDELTEASARAAAELEGGVVFPLPLDSGWRDNDNWGNAGGHWRRGHTGDDFSVACGTPVYAAHQGTVSIRTDQGWSGKWLVTVQTGEGGLATWYAHMMGLATQNGAEVEAGDVIGYVGSLGNSTGCHLHFEVHPLGGSIYEDNVDPVAWLTIARAYPGVS